MTERDRQIMMNLADTIKGEINRMCVTKDLAELDSMTLYARKNIEKLNKMRYEGDFKHIKENKTMTEVKYCDLKIGEHFKLTKNKKDNRLYVKEKDGASKVGCINGKIYPYLDMPVYVEGE